MKNILTILFSLCVFVMFSKGVALADTDPGDAEKEAAVYRLYASYEHRFPAVRGISAEGARSLHQQGRVIFVDVREPAEMDVSMLPDAVSKREYSAHPDRFQNKTAIAYCTIGLRSGEFADKMAEQGITVFNMEGGILAWLWAGGILQGAGERTVEQVHVYAEKWDLAPSGYKTVRFGFWQRLFN
jgi:sodium/bile acid cotransporter 7